LFHAKLGLAATLAEDDALIERLVGLLHAGRVDWTVFWRRLGDLKTDVVPHLTMRPCRTCFAIALRRCLGDRLSGRD